MGTAKCGRNTVGSLVLAPAVGDVGGGGFRLWPLFSAAAAFRRKLADAFVCGVSRHRSNGRGGCGFRRGERGRRAQGPANPPPPAPPSRAGSDRLSDLLKAETEMSSEPDEAEAEAETRRKVEALEEFQRVIKGLQEPSRGVDGEGVDHRRDAAGEARRLAKGDAEAREMLAMLGAIPPLVAMLDSGDVDLQVEALYALLNLGIGNDANKAAVVAAGAVHKMLKLIDSVGTPPAVSMAAITVNFLSLSALDANKPIIGASGAIPFLLETFRGADHPSHAQARQDALRALFNLSIASSNIPRLLSAGIVPILLSVVGDMEVTERALAVLSNVVSTAEGRKAVSRSPQGFPTLVDALDWSDAPGCQEQAAYILMVMAHRSSPDNRAAMLSAGITSSLLELALLGTPLAQRRASRTLERLRLEEGKGKQVSKGPAVSAPLCEGSAPENEGEEKPGMMGEERRAVEQLVQQSLHSNMLRIARRANLPHDPAPPDIVRSLPAASGATSKSLPF